jgi:nucleotide-binding universal stress UspA family protein
MKITKIVVGIDGSPRSAGVLAAAREVAERSRARLVLVHAVSLPAGVPPEYYVYPPEKMPEVLERDARKLLEGYARELPKELEYVLRPSVGTAWNTLCGVAKDEQAELIVIGSHGYGGMDRLLGTTAARVVNHAACSVMVVRP